MKTIHEVSRMSGVSIRTLRYYDSIGLLPPAARTETGYRLYDDTALRRLCMILFYRELEFPLKEIASVIDRGCGSDALDKQIELLTMKRDHLDGLIRYAKEIKEKGGFKMDLTVFNNTKINEYEKLARQQWGDTEQFKEYSKKASGMSPEEKLGGAEKMMSIFAEFGKLRQGSPESPEAQALAAKLRDFITDNYYNCDKATFASLGKMYPESEEFRRNIDSAGGEGTAEFVSEAIAAFCRS